MYSIRNAVRVAMMQVAVIVAGVLASGLWHRAAIAEGVIIPASTVFLFNFGVIGFAIPLIWCSCSLVLAGNPSVSEEARSLMFWFGVLLLSALVCFVLYADISPFFHITWRLGDG